GTVFQERFGGLEGHNPETARLQETRNGASKQVVVVDHRDHPRVRALCHGYHLTSPRLRCGRVTICAPVSAETLRDPLESEADFRPDPGTSRRTPKGTRAPLVPRTSLLATSASRTPCGSFPPRWYRPRNLAWLCRVCPATGRARSPAR